MEPGKYGFTEPEVLKKRWPEIKISGLAYL
jgi:hypothetical protein